MGIVSRSVQIVVGVKDAATPVFNRLKSTIDGLMDSSNLLTAAFEAMVGGAVAEGVEHLVGLFADEELAVVRLNAALRFTGRYSDESTDAIQKMAANIQATTTVGRVQFLELTASIAQIARQITPEQVGEVAKMAIGMAEATGRSVEQTGILIAKTLEGHTNALQRWGIQVDATASQQEKFQQLFQQLSPMFGVAVEATNTLSGQIEQAKNQFQDLERVIGQVIVQVLGLNEKSRSLKDLIIEWTASIRDNFSAWVHYGEVVLAVIEAVIAGLKYLVTGTFELGEIVGTTLNFFGNGFGQLIRMVYDFGGVIGDAVIFGLDWFQSKWDAIENWLIDRINDFIINVIPDKLKNFLGITPILHVVSTATEDLTDDAKNLKAHLTDVESAFVNIGASAAISLGAIKKIWQDLQDGALTFAQAVERVKAVLAKPAPAPASPVSGTPSHEGGGDNFKPPELPSPSDVIRDLSQEQKENEAAFKAGLETWDQYNSKIKQLRTSALELFPELKNLKDKLDLSDVLNKLKGVTIGDELKKAFGLDQADAAENAKKTTQEIAKQSEAIGTDMTKAVMDSIAAHGKFGETVQKEVGKAAASYAKLDFAHALESLAAGLVALAMGDAGAAALDFQSAETYALAGAAMGAIGGATGGFAGGGAAGATGAQAQADAVSNLAGGNVVINVPNTFTSDPAFWDALLGGLEQAGLRRITVTSQG